MNNLDKFYKEDNSPKSFVAKYFDYLKELLDRISVDEVANFIEIIRMAREEERTIFFIGNGGSAATCNHFNNDLAIGTRSKKKPFRAVSLASNISVISAIGNDNGFENVFYDQLRYKMCDGDVVVGISCSGNSPNIVKAIEYANERNCVTVGITGFCGGKLKEISKHQIHLETLNGEYGPVEDIHMIFDHVIGSYFQLYCKNEE